MGVVVDDGVGAVVVIVRAGGRVEVAAADQYATAVVVEDGVVDDVDVVGIVPEVDAVAADIGDLIVLDVAGGGLVDALNEGTASRTDVMDDVADRVDVPSPIITVERYGAATRAGRGVLGDVVHVAVLDERV